MVLAWLFALSACGGPQKRMPKPLILLQLMKEESSKWNDGQ